jgi:hypothetical protein
MYTPGTMRNAAIKTTLKITLYSLPFLLFLANFTEPRGRVAAAPDTTNLYAPVRHSTGSYFAATPAKFTILKSRPRELDGLTRFPGGPVHYPTAAPSVREVRAYVRTQAAQQGVDPQLALWIVKHESSFNPRARGDGEASRGLWQISRVYHPEVTDAQAFSVESSTEWSLGRIRAGKVNEWSSYRNCKTLYEDCPY